VQKQKNLELSKTVSSRCLLLWLLSFGQAKESDKILYKIGLLFKGKFENMFCVIDE
jgi:hypothetical protein